MKKIEDVTIDGTKDGNISLVKLTGLKLKDIHCYVTYEFGDPTIQLSKLVFENDKTLWFEGEHDIAYLSSSTEIPETEEEYLSELSPQDDEED